MGSQPLSTVTKPPPSGLVARRITGPSARGSTTTPTGTPGGYTPPSPEVTMRSPTTSASSGPMRSVSSKVGRLRPTASPAWPVRSTITGTRDRGSVSSSTRADWRPTSSVRPTRPSVPITGMSRVMPSPLPTASMAVRATLPDVAAAMRVVATTVRVGSRTAISRFSCCSSRWPLRAARSRALALSSSASSWSARLTAPK